MYQRPKRRRWPLVLVVLALLAGVAYWAIEIRPGQLPVQTGILPAADVSHLSTALTNPDKNVQATALAIELRPALKRSRGSLLPRGGRITINADTFRTGGQVGGAVQADITGQGRVWLLLIREQGKWLILATEPVR